MSLYFLLFLHPSTLGNTSLRDSFFFFEPPPSLVYPCVLGLGLGVMGNAGLCSHSAHGPFFAHFHHIHSFSTSIYPHHGDPEKAGVM